jgi:hypothetical protein
LESGAFAVLEPFFPYGGVMFGKKGFIKVKVGALRRLVEFLLYVFNRGAIKEVSQRVCYPGNAAVKVYPRHIIEKFPQKRIWLGY